MIDFDPTILRRMIPSRRNTPPLLTAFLESFPGNVSFEFWMFELFVELGILHCPEELLGFGFSGRNFELACDKFGAEQTRRVMKDQLAGVLEKKKYSNNKALQAMVLKAATDPTISLDGIYTLVRFDPGQMF